MTSLVSHQPHTTHFTHYLIIVCNFKSGSFVSDAWLLIQTIEIHYTHVKLFNLI